MKKIKIAEVITRMDWGGSPDTVRLLCERLNPEIYDVRLICGPTVHPSKETGNFFKEFKDNIFYIPHLMRSINIFKDSLAIFSLYRLFRKEKFDIVHTNTAKAGVLGRIAARIAGVPAIVHSSHGHNFYGYFGPITSKMVVILERFMTHFTDKIIALTELEKKDLVAFKVTQPEKIIVINSGLELDNYRKPIIDVQDKRSELKIEQNMSVVGMISRLEPVKGPEYLVQAARLVIEGVPRVKFLIVGEGSLRNKLESQCKKMGILDKFIFAGWREDISQILCVLDILVLSSLNEAVGKVLIEAGACGVPVVATRVGGVPEIVKDNQTGILVPPKDADSLAQAIILLLEDRERRQNMGETAKKWVDDKFSAHRMVERISSLYSDMVKKETTEDTEF